MVHVDLCVIGSGSGNSLLDERFAGLSVALIDKGTFGGTCLNVGCIPTKMFVLPADFAASPEEAHKLGVDLEVQRVRFTDIRDRIFGRIDPISAGGLAWREQQSNVQVFRQRASFVDPHTVELADGTRITADRFVLASGSRPRWPSFEGLDDAVRRGVVHTSDTIMRIDAAPRRMVIFGAGFIAAEFAHVFASFGTEVTIIHRGDSLLRRADGDISRAFTELLGKRVSMRLDQTVVRIEAGDNGETYVTCADANGVEYEYVTDLILNATGRVPNGDLLNVDAAGIEMDDAGFIRVDEHQRTNVEHIWALGDVCSPWMLKHVANHEMRVVQHNLLNPDDLIESDHRFVPSAVFSDPQIASVGCTEEELVASGATHVKVIQEYGSVAYGWALEDQSHFVKLLADPQTGSLLGAHIMGPQASSLIQICIQAMTFGTPVRELARQPYWIHPALPEVIENALLALVEQFDQFDAHDREAKEQ